ncbi:hypothetical protein ES332_A09G138700v1 [Gossypium tomentosum]|uniref:Transducin/WD40 repeat-like superfamily protein n=1 Tax=Gossypium tomentosum TaxID=34277 RepID=A0A5D2P3K0_GOSTO|nr:hypothetical protein ES332_A09G138700v1 [Gossypium tomentosum]
MDNYLVTSKPSSENPKFKPRPRPWRRSNLELNGKFDPKYRHSISDLLMHSYSEIGAFSHFYHIDGKPCQTHINNAVNSDRQLQFRMQGISAIDLDNKGIYIVSVTKSGCLTIHDFETLYCQSTGSLPRLLEDESKHLMHLNLQRQLDDVRWNHANQDEAGLPPLISFKLASKLAKIGSLKAQSDIVPKEIHSIDLDPSCPYQLAFHLDDGWSGVLDIYNLRVTHVHCPPPAWLNGASISTDLLYLRKPSWLPTSSIYAVGSSYDCGIHILDFYPDTSSPSHVDYREDVESLSKMNHQRKKNIFVPLSEGVTTCASHPLNGTIIAGTKHSSLLVVSQPRWAF